jgi:hypothetical protein
MFEKSVDVVVLICVSLVALVVFLLQDSILEAYWEDQILQGIQTVSIGNRRTV